MGNYTKHQCQSWRLYCDAKIEIASSTRCAIFTLVFFSFINRPVIKGEGKSHLKEFGFSKRFVIDKEHY